MTIASKLSSSLQVLSASEQHSCPRTSKSSPTDSASEELTPYSDDSTSEVIAPSSDDSTSEVIAPSSSDDGTSGMLTPSSDDSRPEVRTLI